MTRNKIVLGLALAASLVGFAPVAGAAPIAASRAVTLSSTNGSVDVTPVVVVRRTAVRRPVARRRVVR
ncbi:hypothetical protein [Rhodoblastus sp.]|uniref:hypothetical protein n=1 Tax=Rhodoblastus sp. TaxID=1962975 RepID=UPI003F9BDA40